MPQDKIRPLTSLDHPQSPFYDPEGGAITPVARVVVERIARKVSVLIKCKCLVALLIMQAATSKYSERQCLQLITITAAVITVMFVVKRAHCSVLTASERANKQS